MSLSRTFSPVLHFEDGKGLPLAGGWLCTYLAGTNTPVATFRNGSGTLNPTQIQLDSRGECEVWLDAAIRYKFALYDSTKTTPIWVKDDITAPGVVVMPDTKEVYVVGTSPVLVTAVTLNGITTYTVALDSTFTKAVSDNTQAIADEITRAQNAESGLNTAIGNEVTRATNKENELGTAIANEVTRATAAEKAAKTEVKAGDNINVTKTTGADGHDIYTIEGVESVPNVEITSPNNTISVSSSEDQQTNTKTFSIDVHEKPLSVAWVESDNMTFIPSTNQLSASSYSLLSQYGLQNPQGDKIAYNSTTRKLSLAAGHYTMLVNFLLTWAGTPQNKTIFVNGEPFDLSYQHTQTVTMSVLHQLPNAVDNIGIAVTLSEAPPQGFTCKISRASIYSVQQVLENVVQGLTEVHHDETLSGTGTEDDPLSVEGGGTEYTAGNGIVILSGEISAKLGRGLGFNSQGQMQTLLYDAGDLTDAPSIDVTNNATQQLVSSQSTLTLNVNCEADEVPNFAVEISASAAIALTLTKTVGNTVTVLWPSEEGGTSLESGKYYQVTCVKKCWTLAAFVDPNAQRKVLPQEQELAESETRSVIEDEPESSGGADDNASGDNSEGDVR